MNMEKAIEIAAQCWCDERTSKTTMDTTLATVFAERLVEHTEQLELPPEFNSYEEWIGYLQTKLHKARQAGFVDEPPVPESS